MQFDKILVAGAWRPSETGETLPVVSPSDGREFTLSDTVQDARQI